MNARCRIELFGGLQITVGERVITRFRTRKAASLLAYLAYHLPQAHPREALLEMLWPEVEPATGRNRLRMALTFLRHPLEPPGVPAGAVLIADRTSVRLNPLAVTTDVSEFQTALKQVSSAESNEERARHLTQAIELYYGELLSGFYDNWVQTEQQRLTEQLLQAIRHVVACCIEMDDLNGALHYTLRAVSLDPLNEEANVDIMRLYAAADRPMEALRQYQELERLLRMELCERPSPAARQLAETLRREVGPQATGGDRCRKRPSPRPKSCLPTDLNPTQHTENRILALPLQFTRFFGREEEIVCLMRMLTGETNGKEGAKNPQQADNSALIENSFPRLITLTGTAGSGKTRLAIEVAGKLAEDFHGGLWFVPLADLFDPGLMPGMIGDVLRLPRSPHREPLDQVTEFLNGRNAPVLLVLDNLEHLLAEKMHKSEDGAAVARALLERIPSLTLLVTSRQILGLEGEREFPVAPLPTPDSGVRVFRCSGNQENASPTPYPRTPEQLIQFASVRLFADRAQAIKADFQVTKGNVEAIARLCDRLEGIPLALELAAAWAQTLTPAQMLSRLEQRFDFLVSRRRDATKRHRTLWSAIELSYRLLSPAQQRFFAKLSVFRGGWTVEAAQAVCEEPTTLDWIALLCDSSLVLAEERGGAMRFRMLETLREFGEQKLRMGDGVEHTLKQHCEWFLSLAENAERQLTGSEQASWLERLEQDHDNFRSALAWCEQQEKEAESGLRMAAALFRFWMVRGHFIEGRSHLTRTLGRMEQETPTEFHAKALNGLGAFTAMQGDIESAKTLFQQSLAIRKRLGDKILIAAALNNLGTMEQENDLCDYTSARERFEESLKIYNMLGDKGGAAYSLSRLARIAYFQGDYEKAWSLYAEGLALRRQVGDPYGIAMSLQALGNVARDLGRYVEAKTLNEESLEIKRTLDDRWGIAEALNTLGVVARDTGDYAAARTLHEESLRIFRAMADKGCTANALTMLGRVAFYQGDYAGARKLYAEGLVLRRELGNKRITAECLEAIAELLLAEEQRRKAVQIWGAAGSLRECTRSAVVPAERDQYTRLIARARSLLGEANFTSAWESGRAMTLEVAIAYALEEDAT